MRTRQKIWIGLGAFVVADAGLSAALPGVAHDDAPAGLRAPIVPGSRMHLAQHAAMPDQGSEAGESGVGADLAPDLAFALKIALVRGHLRVGDELVRQQQWAAALPHFLHPGEEIYGSLKSDLAAYDTPAFEAQLKALAALVKAKKGGPEYEQARRAVETALGAADRHFKAAKGAEWPSFVVATAIEALRTAAGEYGQALAGDRIAKPVEYQDARGFVFQAGEMIDAAATELKARDAEAFERVRAALAEVKTAWPAAQPPRTAVKDHASVLSDIARVELAAGPLM